MGLLYFLFFQGLIPRSPLRSKRHLGAPRVCLRYARRNNQEEAALSWRRLMKAKVPPFGLRKVPRNSARLRGAICRSQKRPRLA